MAQAIASAEFRYFVRCWLGASALILMWVG
jgi:hypothetical protein